MNFQQINSEPDDTKNELIQTRTSIKHKKRNAMTSCKDVENFNDQAQFFSNKPLMSLFLKNIYIKRFRTKLLHKKKILEKYSTQILQLIGDKSARFIIEKKQDTRTSIHLEMIGQITRVFQNRFIVNITKMFNRIPLILPEHYIKIFVDILGIASRLYFLYFIPVDLAWAQNTFLFENYWVTTLIMIMIQIFEFIFNLNVACYKEGIIVKSRKYIAKKLICKSNGLELISTIILILAIIFPAMQTKKQEANYTNLIFLLFLSHINTIDKAVSTYETAINLSKKVSSYLTLAKLLLFFFYIVHTFACLWFWVGMRYAYDPSNWLSRYEILDDSWDQQYLVSFYYACVTMFTVGYGDITPKTTIEKVITIFFIILSSVQLPYSVNTIGNIIQQISIFGEEKKKKLRTINTYMQKKHVPYNLQNQVRQYLDYYWQLQVNEESEDEKLIIQQLPEYLRDTILIKANHSFFNQIQFFKDNFSISFKQQLLKKIKQQVIQNEQIIQLNTISEDICLLYVEEGQIDVYADDKLSFKIRQVNKQQTIGLDTFVTNAPVKEYYKSNGITKVLMLYQKDFNHLLTQFPQDFETYCKLKDDSIFNQEIQLCESECCGCFMKTHKAQSCPYIHYVPQKDFIIKKYNLEKHQTRKVLHRIYPKRKTYFPLSELNMFKRQFSIITHRFISPLHYQTKQQTVKIQNQSLLKYDQPLKLIDYGTSGKLATQNELKQSVYKSYIQPTLKSIFINAVRKVIIIQRWFGKSDLSMIQRFEQSFDCKVIRELMINIKKGKEVNQRDLEQIEMLLIKTKNFSKVERRKMQQFEQAKDYNIYFLNDNVNKIIESANSTQYQKYYISKLQTLLPYLKFPGNFIKQYKVKMKHRKLKRQSNNFLL